MGMSLAWETTRIKSLGDARGVLLDLTAREWMCRGQPQPYGNLIPSIDRKPRQSMSRAQKLEIERRSIDSFRSTVRFFSDPREAPSLRQDIVALMVMRHHDVPKAD